MLQLEYSSLYCLIPSSLFYKIVVTFNKVFITVLMDSFVVISIYNELSPLFIYYLLVLYYKL